MKKKKTEITTGVHSSVPASLYNKLEKVAYSLRKTKSEVIREILERYLNQYYLEEIEKQKKEITQR